MGPMNRPPLTTPKPRAGSACSWPLGRPVHGAFTLNGLGPDATATIALSTGYTTLMLLTIGLRITPVRRLSPRLSWIIKIRRLIGLLDFSYVTVHLLASTLLYNNIVIRALL